MAIPAAPAPTMHMSAGCRREPDAPVVDDHATLPVVSRVRLVASLNGSTQAPRRGQPPGATTRDGGAAAPHRRSSSRLGVAAAPSRHPGAAVVAAAPRRRRCSSTRARWSWLPGRRAADGRERARSPPAASARRDASPRPTPAIACARARTRPRARDVPLHAMRGASRSSRGLQWDQPQSRGGVRGVAICRAGASGSTSSR